MTGQIVQIVSDMTGYPADLLDLDLDLEADLGIDTVKQAEMFAAVRERFGIPREENLRLRDFPTLAHVIGFARDRARPSLPHRRPPHRRLAPRSRPPRRSRPPPRQRRRSRQPRADHRRGADRRRGTRGRAAGHR